MLAGKCNEPPEQAYFNEQVRPLLTENDHVYGQVDAVSKRKLAAALFPIQWEEPFGMVMIEAMACGTPVVALRGGAVPEVIVDGVTGVVCDRPDELPAAIERAQTMDPVVCRRHVAAHFGVAQFGSGYERIYRTVVGTAVSASRQANCGGLGASGRTSRSRQPHDRTADPVQQRRPREHRVRRRHRDAGRRRHVLPLRRAWRRAGRTLARSVRPRRPGAVEVGLRVDGQPSRAVRAPEPFVAKFILRRSPRAGLADSTLLLVRERLIADGLRKPSRCTTLTTRAWWR